MAFKNSPEKLEILKIKNFKKKSQNFKCKSHLKFLIFNSFKNLLAILKIENFINESHL